MVAVGTGLAVGLGMYAFQGRNAVETPLMVVRPVRDKFTSEFAWAHIPEEEEAVPEEDSSAFMTDIEDAVTTPNETTVQETPPPPDTQKDKKERKPAADAPAEKREKVAITPGEPAQENGDEPVTGRERRRRANRDETDELPEDPLMRRTRDGVHRIREIFEGTP